MNTLNGGQHAQKPPGLQAVRVLPVGAPTFGEAVRWGAEVYAALKKVLHDRKLNTNVGDEGGFAPSLGSNREALELIVAAIESAGYKPGGDIALGIDAAASEFFANGTYQLAREGRSLDAAGMIALYEQWIGQFPIISVEDGLAADDWQGWAAMTPRLGGRGPLRGRGGLATRTGRPAPGP